MNKKIKLFRVKRDIIDFDQASVMGKNVIKISEDTEARWLCIAFLFYNMQRELKEYFMKKNGD